MDLNKTEDLISKYGVIKYYNPDCVRKKSNWSKLGNAYKFDTPDFNPQSLENVIPDYSPKLDTLLKNIEDLDKKDKVKYGRLFKHFIFSDLKAGAYGAKLISSALIAKGWKLGYTAPYIGKEKETTGGGDSSSSSSEGEPNNNKIKKPKKVRKYGKIELLPQSDLDKTEYKNFFLLCSSGIYEQPISVDLKKKILTRFNQRPDNIYGSNTRIIVMDSGYKEGIDLFDIKYIHIFEPSIVNSDQKQIIGRGTRTCGQKGLDFHPTKGWPLYVFIYDLSFPEPLRPAFFGMNTAIDLYLHAMNFDFRLYRFIEEIDKYTIIGSVDYELNKSVHTFSLSSTTSSVGGGDRGFFIGKDDYSPPDAISRMGYSKTQKYIKNNFGKYAWPPLIMENQCGTVDKKGGASTLMKYTPTQNFISHYFTPTAPVNGMLLYHSTGTGKTCSAIVAATSSFENEGYTILWVTRTTLKNDIWKNMFDLVCNETIATKIREQGLQIPDEQGERMRLLSKSWRIRPMSYKQFSNLVSKSNKFYEELVKINGTTDPLRKTLLIIDEAQKLYGGGDLSSIERPDMNALHNALMTSYEISGKDSVKLLLMTATPITENPMELIKLLNLCKPIQEQMPTEFNEFSALYLNDEGKFTDEGKARYLDDIAGYISYLNREKDARQFSQPQIKHITTPIVEVETTKKYEAKIRREIATNEKENNKQKEEEEKALFEAEKASLETEMENLSSITTKEIQKELNGKYCDDRENPKQKKLCNKAVVSTTQLIIKEIKDTVRKMKETLKEKKAVLKGEKKKKEEKEKYPKPNKEDEAYFLYKEGAYRTLRKKCAVPLVDKKDIEKALENHPDILKYHKKIEEYKREIEKLETQFHIAMGKQNTQIDIWKELLTKSYITDDERKTYETKIKDETVRNHKRKILLKNALEGDIEDVKEEIRYTLKDKREGISKLRNTIKKRLNTVKREKMKQEKNAKKEAEKTRKKLEREAKKLRKTQRKNALKELDIENPVVKEAIDKYKDKIKEEIEIAEEALKAKEAVKQREKEQKKADKEMEKEQKKTDKKRETEMKKQQKERERITKKAMKEREKEEKKALKPNRTTRKRSQSK